MSSTQRTTRRLSARIQAKDATRGDENSLPQSDDAPTNGGSKNNARKRKPSYEEEDDGFMFSRVKKKRPKDVPPAIPEEDVPVKQNASIAATRKPLVARPADTTATIAIQNTEDGTEIATTKRQKKKMSFSTPVATEKQPIRKSKRLSHEDQQHNPVHKPRRKMGVAPEKSASPVPSPRKTVEAEVPAEVASVGEQSDNDSQPQHSGTKIALPFADTPVIRRNKEMRENKNGQRRSSLSSRGRRASSLIETGNSNGEITPDNLVRPLTNSIALPHDEVDIADFYKHIEADGLPEPRRMRQLLSWCATRSLDQKPMGATFEVSSAIAAARVIQDELLKDLGNKSELSDWFSREDAAPPPKELPERPNPKNIQNTDKIAELEQQIEKLKSERDALENLLKSPPSQKHPRPSDLDASLLSPEEAEMLHQLQSRPNQTIESRVDQIFDKLEPNIDAFADGVHKVAQYRDAADNVASRVLSIAAEKLAEQENEGRRRAKPERDRSPRRDLGSVLRGLSRIDR
ncbi:Kinetochore protein mis13 [Cyphellophora attinorum]|uniref:Kinetochore protein mis13 n=1 Tax=Cyphellophora attinorum TaxID=1664694 RepID=A0A0N1H8P3_9EURO|nr:Kinetochore protein mis13 [Phialophora attinorum]KPI39605.1 Kinetochore protein mis13 [Phialophora attinorum]